MSKHTAGPWRVGTGGDGNPRVYPRGKNPICAFGDYSGDEVEYYKNHEANARLITAAPKLLSSLQWAVSFIAAGEMDSETERRVNKAMVVIGKIYGLKPGQHRHNALTKKEGT